jgi:transposase-like protein
MLDMAFPTERPLSKEEATRLYLQSQAIVPVGEIARRAGVTRQTLHNWAQEALGKKRKAPAPDTSTGPTTNPEGSVTDGSAKPNVPDASTTKDTGGK